MKAASLASGPPLGASETVRMAAHHADLLIHEVAMIPQALLDKYPSYRAILAHHISPEEAGKLVTAAQPKQVGCFAVR